MVEERGRAIVTRLKKNQRSVIENFKDSYNVHISSTGRIAVIKKRDFKVKFLENRYSYSWNRRCPSCGGS